MAYFQAIFPMSFRWTQIKVKPPMQCTYMVDPGGLLGKAPGAGPCEVVSVAAALGLAGWLLG